MNNNKLLQKSQEFKRQADEILSNFKLVEGLCKYGEVKFTGSYPLNVMMRPDLDVYAIAKENSKEKMLEVIHNIFSTVYFEEIRFTNYLDFHKDQDDHKGYYIQPHKRIGENKWKLDVWLMTEDRYEPHTEHFLDLLNKDEDADKKRLIILELKNYYREGEKYKKGINGRVIYEAVLEQGIKNVMEFEAYLKNK